MSTVCPSLPLHSYTSKSLHHLIYHAWEATQCSIGRLFRCYGLDMVKRSFRNIWFWLLHGRRCMIWHLDHSYRASDSDFMANPSRYFQDIFGGKLLPSWIFDWLFQKSNLKWVCANSSISIHFWKMSLVYSIICSANMSDPLMTVCIKSAQRVVHANKLVKAGSKGQGSAPFFFNMSQMKGFQRHTSV